MGYCNRCGEISNGGKCRKCGGRSVGMLICLTHIDLLSCWLFTSPTYSIHCYDVIWWQGVRSTYLYDGRSMAASVINWNISFNISANLTFCSYADSILSQRDKSPSPSVSASTPVSCAKRPTAASVVASTSPTQEGRRNKVSLLRKKANQKKICDNCCERGFGSRDPCQHCERLW